MIYLKLPCTAVVLKDERVKVIVWSQKKDKDTEGEKVLHADDTVKAFGRS